MLSQRVQLLVERFVEKFGQDALESSLREAGLLEDAGVLTIIANEGVHPLAEAHCRGEIFVASRGNLDFSSEASANSAMRDVLLETARKLKSQRWRRIYIVPFGPAVLSMQIKALVYRILHIETVDVLHAGSGTYFDVDLNIRQIVLEAEEGYSTTAGV